jgi:hypothetical protein
MPTKPKRPPKTIKEKKFVKEYIKTGNATEAAARVYDVASRDTARNIGTQNVAKLSFPELMDKMGITDEKLNLVLEEGLAATRSISAIAGTEANGGTVDFVDVPDFMVRHKYLETGLKLKDKFPTSRVDHTTKGDKIETNTIIFTEFGDETEGK